MLLNGAPAVENLLLQQLSAYLWSDAWQISMKSWGINKLDIRQHIRRISRLVIWINVTMFSRSILFYFQMHKSAIVSFKLIDISQFQQKLETRWQSTKYQLKSDLKYNIKWISKSPLLNGGHFVSISSLLFCTISHVSVKSWNVIPWPT